MFEATFAFCKLCRTDVNIAHGCRDDIQKHFATKHATAWISIHFKAAVTYFSVNIQFNIDISLVSSLLAFVLMPDICSLLTIETLEPLIQFLFSAKYRKRSWRGIENDTGHLWIWRKLLTECPERCYTGV